MKKADYFYEDLLVNILVASQKYLGMIVSNLQAACPILICEDKKRIIYL